MQLPDLKQLNRLITLCRKKGVTSIKIDNIELTLSETVPTYNKQSKNKTVSSETAFDTDTLTDEQLLMWSAGVPIESESKS